MKRLVTIANGDIRVFKESFTQIQVSMQLYAYLQSFLLDMSSRNISMQIMLICLICVSESVCMIYVPSPNMSNYCFRCRVQGRGEAGEGPLQGLQ